MRKTASKFIFLALFLLVLLTLSIVLGVCLKAALKTTIPIAPVPTGSMEPTIHVGSLLILQGVKPEDVNVGDIVVYKLPYAQKHTILFIFSEYKPAPIVHRVIAKVCDDGECYFLTKGDANQLPDQNPLDVDTWLRGEDIIGKVVLIIPYIGYFYIWAKTPVGIVIIVALIVYLAASCVFTDTKGKKHTKESLKTSSIRS